VTKKAQIVNTANSAQIEKRKKRIFFLRDRPEINRLTAGPQLATSRLASLLPPAEYHQYSLVGRSGRARDLSQLRPPRLDLFISGRSLPLALAIFFFSMAAHGQDNNQYTEITGTGLSLYRIAIPPVLDGGGASEIA